ncbi:MAG: hybrid sensor histidine kinase/response regulator [Gemmatimonas sp.]|nr:hybrid sensor histidine kinase/response regulator [Gemmatimonas sp.]
MPDISPGRPTPQLDPTQMYRDLVELSPEAAYIVADGRFVYLNPAAVALFGADSASRLLGRDVLERVHPDDHALALARRKLVLTTGAPAPMIEMRFIALDGRIFEVEVHATKLIFDGRPATYAAARDVSARKRLEEQVRESQKLEAVGRLAGGIAHDFNNTLAVILGHSEMLLADLPADHAMREELEAIHRAAQHSATLTRQLLTYARRQPIQPRPLDLNVAVHETLRMLRPLLGENVALDWSPDDGPCEVLLDPSQLDQILTNLCANARDAIDGVGSLRIATRRCLIDAPTAPALRELEPGAYVMLSCHDSGRGVPEELLDRIFEPFFTTKPQGRGTGLGLSTVYGIVRQHHGAITVQSAPGGGTRFDLYFPEHSGARAAVADKTPAVISSRRAKAATILIVEDEAAVLQLTRRALESQGYRVLAAGGPEAALSLLEAHPEQVDLLLTDVMMPVMSGPDLARIVRGMRPDVGVLFMSGYSADLIARQDRLAGDADLLSKPFTLAELALKVHEALERRTAA